MDSTTTLQISRLEKLPVELLHKIIASLKPCLTQDSSPIPRHVIHTKELHDTTNLKAQKNLISCLATSSSLQVATIPILYQKVELSTYSALLKFHHQILRYPELGCHVRSLDLRNLCLGSRGNGTGIHEEENQKLLDEVKAAEDMTAKLLSFMPRLRELRTPMQSGYEARVHSRLQGHLDLRILQRLLRGQLPSLTTLEWRPIVTPEFLCFLGRCGKGVETQVRRMVVRSSDGDITSAVKLLLGIMPRIQDLEFMTEDVELVDALNGLCGNTRLRTLVASLRDYEGISKFSKFISSNPEIFSKLETLHLRCTTPATAIPQPDPETRDDISTIITLLPSSLRSLNLPGIPISPSYLELLPQYCPVLEELALDTGFQLEDLESIILPPHTITGESPSQPASRSHGNQDDVEAKYNTVLQPMAKAIAICKLRRRINNFCLTPHPSTGYLSRLKYLDIAAMSVYEQKKLFSSLLLSEFSGVEKIVIGEWNASDMLFGAVCGGVGWKCGSRGRSFWVERVGG